MRALGNVIAARIASEPPPAHEIERAFDFDPASPISDPSPTRPPNSNSPMKLRGTIDALVDIERHALDIGAIEEIGGGLARGDAGVDQRQKARALLARQRGVEKRIERVDGQAQALRGR